MNKNAKKNTRMSDSVKKYYELMEDENYGLDKSPVERRDDEIYALMTRATKAGKIVEVQTRAAEVMK